MNDIDIKDKLFKTGELIFSICSLTLSLFLFLLIVFNKSLRSLTYDFLMCVFISEIINSIGNIIQLLLINMGIGDWGLGIGDWAQSPIPNPQSPIPNVLKKMFFN